MASEKKVKHKGKGKGKKHHKGGGWRKALNLDIDGALRINTTTANRRSISESALQTFGGGM